MRKPVSPGFPASFRTTREATSRVIEPFSVSKALSSFAPEAGSLRFRPQLAETKPFTSIVSNHLCGVRRRSGLPARRGPARPRTLPRRGRRGPPRPPRPRGECAFARSWTSSVRAASEPPDPPSAPNTVLHSGPRNRRRSASQRVRCLRPRRHAGARGRRDESPLLRKARRPARRRREERLRPASRPRTARRPGRRGRAQPRRLEDRRGEVPLPRLPEKAVRSRVRGRGRRRGDGPARRRLLASGTRCSSRRASAGPSRRRLAVSALHVAKKPASAVVRGGRRDSRGGADRPPGRSATRRRSAPASGSS